MSADLALSSFSIRDFIYKTRLPEDCTVCHQRAWPLANYNMRAEHGDTEYGHICKDCVPKLVIGLVSQTAANVDAAQQGIDCDERDLRDEEETSKDEFVDFKDWLEKLPEEEKNKSLVLRSLSPAFLYYKLRGKHPRCGQCQSEKVLLSFVWYDGSTAQRGKCCHQCAFNFASILLTAVLEAQQQARLLPPEKSSLFE